jgi:ubiquinone biosynthesis UbiH/UbiF/VisC/COQ6 family hydroxylase
MQSFDVVIVGGGLVGASFALALSGAAVSVAVVEPQGRGAEPNDDTWDSRVYALSPGNAQWLHELGIWERLAPARVQRVERMRIFGDRAPARLEFSAYDAGLRELAWIVENRLLQNTLRDALEAAPHVSLISPVRCEDLAWQEDSAVLTLSDGQALHARLMVGADGADSWVRERMGVAVSTNEYPELGVVANFATARPHDGTAFQWFRPDGVLALLPLPGYRVSMVWSAVEARARELLAAPEAILANEVAEASGAALGALSVITSAAGFPLRRQRVERLVEPRAALIGDAAHNVHPLAGQGVNLGFRDARELASVLRGRGAQRDCGDYRLLRRYERARREDIAALDFTTHGLEKLFGSQAVWMAGLRNWGLTLVDAQPLLKNALVRRAAA